MLSTWDLDPLAPCRELMSKLLYSSEHSCPRELVCLCGAPDCRAHAHNRLHEIQICFVQCVDGEYQKGGEKMHINLKSAIHPQCNFVVMLLHRIADVSQCDIFFYYSHIGQRPPPFPPPTCEEIKLYLLWLRNVFPQMKSFSHQFSFLRVRKTFLGSC